VEEGAHDALDEEDAAGDELSSLQAALAFTGPGLRRRPRERRRADRDGGV
jgi:hypothetical protein